MLIVLKKANVIPSPIAIGNSAAQSRHKCRLDLRFEYHGLLLFLTWSFVPENMNWTIAMFFGELIVGPIRYAVYGPNLESGVIPMVGGATMEP